MKKIFISYKRVDYKKVFAIKKGIEEATGLECWVDLDGIESDAQFKHVIIRAIDECEVLLFMYSKEHASITDFENDWTMRELGYAARHGKRVVFVNIDGTPLAGVFDFDYGTKQQVNGRSKKALAKLHQDLRHWLIKPEHTTTGQTVASEPNHEQEQEPAPVQKPAQEPTSATEEEQESTPGTKHVSSLAFLRNWLTARKSAPVQKPAQEPAQATEEEEQETKHVSGFVYLRNWLTARKSAPVQKPEPEAAPEPAPVAEPEAAPESAPEAEEMPAVVPSRRKRVVISLIVALPLIALLTGAVAYGIQSRQQVEREAELRSLYRQANNYKYFGNFAQAQAYYKQLADAGVYAGYLGQACVMDSLENYQDAIQCIQRGIDLYHSNGPTQYDWDVSLSDMQKELLHVRRHRAEQSKAVKTNSSGYANKTASAKESAGSKTSSSSANVTASFNGLHLVDRHAMKCTSLSERGLLTITTAGNAYQCLGSINSTDGSLSISGWLRPQDDQFLVFDGTIKQSIKSRNNGETVHISLRQRVKASSDIRLWELNLNSESSGAGTLYIFLNE